MTSNLITRSLSTCSDEKVGLLTSETQRVQDMIKSGQMNMSNISLHYHLSTSQKCAIFVMPLLPSTKPAVGTIHNKTKGKQRATDADDNPIIVIDSEDC